MRYIERGSGLFKSHQGYLAIPSFAQLYRLLRAFGMSDQFGIRIRRRTQNPSNEEAVFVYRQHSTGGTQGLTSPRLARWS